MLVDIISVKVTGAYTLFLQFEDGLEGYVDLSTIIPFEGIFRELKDLKYFSTVRVEKDLGTIVWDNGADLSPNYLYSLIRNHKV
jgi:hypothetical protein